MAATTELSDLPDLLLRRILYFAPAKEAASTTVLARRWRSLWLNSGAVNPDSRSYDRSYDRQRPYGFDDVSGKAEAFNRRMEAALSAAKPVRRLTLHVDKCCYDTHFFTAYRAHGRREHDMVRVLLASPAARAAEELAVVIAPHRDYPADNDHHGMSSASLNFGSLPSETLRALHASNVGSLVAPPPASVFPRLAELRLRRCGVSVADLQRVIDAAPQLATLHLERYSFGERGYGTATATTYQKNPGGRLVCPAVTALVLKDCSWPGNEQGRVELDVPRLQYFRYKGRVGLVMERVFLKLSAASPSVVGVDLHFDAEFWRNARARVFFWEFLQSFNTAKVLKLKMDLTADHVALADKHRQDELVLSNRLFHILERLEVEVPLEPAGESETLALFIANLLCCCPVLRDLHLKLTTKASNQTGLGAWAEFDKSIDNFRHHRKSPKILFNADDDESYNVSDIPGLSDHSFDCLKSSLRKVILQFWMEGPINCFEVQLAKFFAENAMVLQEISIHDGNHKLHEHMNRMLRRWIAAGSSKRKNSPTTTAFRESCPSKRQR
jgi:hypothetical protein